MNLSSKNRFFVRLVVITLFVAGLQGYCQSPCCSSCGTFSLKADFLYLKAQENGLAYGIVTEGDGSLVPPASPLNYGFKSKVKSPKFKWEAGSRLRFGYRCSCTPLDTFVEWMQFDATANGSVNLSRPKTDKYFISTWSRPTLTALCSFLREVSDNTTEQHARAKLDLDLDIVDFGLRYLLSPSARFSLKPQLAVRVGLIDQTYKLVDSFEGTILVSGTSKESTNL